MGLESQQSNQGQNNKQKEYLAYLCDRAQKLTKAVYRVTDMMSDQEPLKWKIRESAVVLFTDISYLKGKDFLERMSYLPRLETSTDELVLLLSLVGDENSISGVNFEILKDEYHAIKKSILKESKSSSFEEIFLKGSIEPPADSIGQKLIGQANGHDNGQPNKSDAGDAGDAGTVEKRNKTVATPTPSIRERKNKVFETVKKKGRVSVGEISSLFSEFSEKTIQRDLLEMVNNGILRKEGDKRWRIYVFDNV